MILANRSLSKCSVIPIPAIPDSTPTGIPIAANTKASKNTERLICCEVAPILDNSPKYFVRWLIEIENELYIKDTEPAIIRAINMAPRLYSTIR